MYAQLPAARQMLMVTQHCRTQGMCDGGEVQVERHMTKMFTLENLAV